MSKAEDFGEFISENKDLLKDYFETRMEVYRLQAVKTFSKTTGLVLWVIVLIFLLFLVMAFIGVVLGFWFSALFNSHVLGFGLATLIMMIITGLVAFFRRQLFINPIIRWVISDSGNNDETEFEINS